MQDKFKIGDVLEGHRGERHLVVLHEYPDPDAISCAVAHRLISAHFDIDVDIVYTGKISHQQNIALVRLLAADLLQYDESTDLGTYQAAIFIDHQGTTDEKVVSALESAGVPVLLVVDHHQTQTRLNPEFSHIEQTGATATIYTMFLREGVVELDTAHKEHVLVATALMHGILSDTSGFVRAGADDLEAAAFLSRFRDAEMLEQIMSQARSKHAMDIIHRALGNRITVENFSIAGIGFLRAEDRDAIPEAADFLLTEENVHTAIVYGIVSDDDQEETVVGSMRTAKFTLDPDQFIKDAFGKGLSGQYFGGGKPAAGAFAIPIGFLSGEPSEKYHELKWDLYDIQIKSKIFAKLGVKPEIP
jgi:nanoRNase/pAp phosphatase (c-di-AMP/oligoRNAs hydrolase)